MIASIAKAITAGVTTFGTTFATCNLDNHVTGSEWVAIAASSIVAVFAVYAMPNSVPTITTGE